MHQKVLILVELNVPVFPLVACAFGVTPSTTELSLCVFPQRLRALALAFRPLIQLELLCVYGVR